MGMCYQSPNLKTKIQSGNNHETAAEPNGSGSGRSFPLRWSGISPVALSVPVPLFRREPRTGILPAGKRLGDQFGRQSLHATGAGADLARAGQPGQAGNQEEKPRFAQL